MINTEYACQDTLFLPVITKCISRRIIRKHIIEYIIEEGRPDEELSIEYYPPDLTEDVLVRFDTLMGINKSQGEKSNDGNKKNRKYI